MAKKTARKLLWPTNKDILVRVVFLHVGQGSSSLVLVADGDSYKTLLVDINRDGENGGINVAALITDLLDGEPLHAFVNTHPHDDHLRGVTELSEAVDINQVWHSGHVPSKKYGAAYDDLKKLIKKVKDAGGSEVTLQGSKQSQSIGDGKYHVLAPAEYVTDDVNEDEADERYRRIHEQCAVLKFGDGSNWIMIAGDADRDAFEKHIVEYHKDRLGAVALAAPHHGSRTFFRYDEKDDAYLKGLEAINPDYVIISAPTVDESKHDHPHKDAVKLYADHVTSDCVLHTGENRYSYICDIYRDGTYSGVQDDKGELAAEYTIESEDEEKDSGARSSAAAAAAAMPSRRTRVDDRPMGRQ